MTGPTAEERKEGYMGKFLQIRSTAGYERELIKLLRISPKILTVWKFTRAITLLEQPLLRFRRMGPSSGC